MKEPPKVRVRRKGLSVSLSIEMPDDSAAKKAELRWGTGPPPAKVETSPEAITLRVPPGTTKHLQAKARAEGLHVADLVRKWIAEKLG